MTDIGAEAVREESWAWTGDLQAMGFVAQHHPDAEVREMWLSIYMGELDVLDGEWEQRPRPAGGGGRG